MSVSASRRARAVTRPVGPSAHGEPGARFGRLFPRRRTPPLSPTVLKALAATMRERDLPGSDADRVGRSALHAGYTYLGQFIDHDLTLDRTRFRIPVLSWWPQRNFRSPRFDLDCLYGRGPGSARDGDLYDPPDGPRLRLNGHDLARKSAGRDEGLAYIRDPRNDSNRIVSQVHVAFARFHNKIIDTLTSGGAAGAGVFAAARGIARRHYQWIVLKDFLPTIVGQALVDRVRSESGGLPPHSSGLYHPGAIPFMPVEFSGAAFRLGHSMVRSSYLLNSGTGQVSLFPPRDDDLSAGLRGQRPLPRDMVIEWDRFFRSRTGIATRVQFARPIDTGITAPLFEMPVTVAEERSQPGRNLAFRNLMRGEYNLGLPTGQQVADAMVARGLIGPRDTFGAHRPMRIALGQLTRGGADDLDGTGISLDQLTDMVRDRTPLWYYVLKEAEALHGGEMLGPVGGRIVAEVFIGLLLADADSILRNASGWTPRRGEFGCPSDGQYDMTDLLEWLGR